MDGGAPAGAADSTTAGGPDAAALCADRPARSNSPMCADAKGALCGGNAETGTHDAHRTAARPAVGLTSPDFHFDLSILHPFPSPSPGGNRFSSFLRASPSPVSAGRASASQQHDAGLLFKSPPVARLTHHDHASQPLSPMPWRGGLGVGPDRTHGGGGADLLHPHHPPLPSAGCHVERFHPYGGGNDSEASSASTAPAATGATDAPPPAAAAAAALGLHAHYASVLSVDEPHMPSSTETGAGPEGRGSGPACIATLLDRRAQLVVGHSLYACGRSWTHDAAPPTTAAPAGLFEEDQPSMVLPAPLPHTEASLATLMPTTKHIGASSDAIMQCEYVASDLLLAKHVMYWREVKKWWNAQRQHRLNRFKARLALLLPMVPNPPLLP